MDLNQAIALRRSVRGFLPRPVPKETLERIFERAQRAPSWCNIQPWRVWLTSGEATRRLTSAITEAAKGGAPQPDLPFPARYPEPYDRHRKECGKALYEAMGVERGDQEARWNAWLRNFAAFDAPHVAIVCVDRRFGEYAALDIGCWLGNLLLLATSEGVATCAQASLSTFPAAVRSVLDIPDELAILFGISIGYEDESHAANACRTTREHVDANVTFVDG